MNAMVGDLMNWTSLTIRPDCPADRALAILSESDAEALLVVDADDRFLGLITGYELLKADLNGTLSDSVVEQLMHSRPQSLGPQQTIGEAAKLFREAALSQIPVLRDGRLLGAIERKAVLRWVAALRRRDAESAIIAPKYLQRTSEPSALPADR